MRTTLVILAALLLAPSVARADAEADGGTKIAYSHRHQVGFHFQPGLGYRVLFPYEKEPPTYCGQDGKSVCTGRAPFFLDAGVSFGVSRSLELMFEMRFGLEGDFRSPTAPATADRPQALAIQPGLKLYVDDEGSFKFFSTVQLSFDFTDYSSTGLDKDTDFAVRNANGFQLDFHKTFGAYFFIGETIGFARWLRFEIDAGIGLQARFP